MKKRNRIVYFLQEIAIVVLGVLIAVAISNYKEKLDNNSYLKKTLVAVENEVESSKMEVDSVLSKHIRLYEILENKIGDNEQSLGELISSSGGFQVASITNVSLRFFIANKAELLEFELISQLLDIEAKTNILSDKIDRLSDFAYENVNEGNDEVKIKFAYRLLDVIDVEQTLLESYTNFLENNESYLKRITK